MSPDPAASPLLFVRESEITALPDRDETVTQLTRELAALMGLQDEEEAVMAALEREHMEPTFVSKGLAVPHGRIAGLARPGVYAARSAKGVDWDLGTANFVILLLVPEEHPEIHLGLLRNLMRWRYRLGEDAAHLLTAPAAELEQSLAAALN